METCGGRVIRGGGRQTYLIGYTEMAPIMRQPAAQNQKRVITHRRREPETTCLLRGPK